MMNLLSTLTLIYTLLFWQAYSLDEACSDDVNIDHHMTLTQ